MVLFKYPSHYRLLKSEQYKKVLIEGRKVTTRALKACILANSFCHPRLGVVVAKRNILQANRRNYFKRLNKETFRLNQHILLPLDIVIVANRIPKDSTKQELYHEISALWKKLLSLSQI